MTEDEKAKTLAAYKHYCVTMRSIGWPADSHEDWYAKHGNAPVEPVTDRGPQWGTWGDHAAANDHSQQPRATRGLRSRVARMLAAGMDREKIAELMGFPVSAIDAYADAAPRDPNGEKRGDDDHASLSEKRARKLARAQELGRHAPPKKHHERTRRKLGAA